MELDDHQRYSVKDIAMRIILDEKHKPLQGFALWLIDRSFTLLHADVIAQLSFLSDYVDDWCLTINDLLIEHAQERQSQKVLSEGMQKKTMF
jgi:hypothetical protein